MSKKSRDKGMRAQREVAAMLSKWWGSEFHSTPGSGSFATRTKNVYQLSGDVSTPDESFPFCVEVKNQEGWHLEQLLTAPECDIVQWWRQTVNQCPADKIPLLVFTRNYLPYFFVMPTVGPVALDQWTIEIDGKQLWLGLFKEHLIDQTATSTWKELTERKL